MTHTFSTYSIIFSERNGHISNSTAMYKIMYGSMKTIAMQHLLICTSLNYTKIIVYYLSVRLPVFAKLLLLHILEFKYALICITHSKP